MKTRTFDDVNSDLESAMFRAQCLESEIDQEHDNIARLKKELESPIDGMSVGEYEELKSVEARKYAEAMGRKPGGEE